MQYKSDVITRSFSIAEPHMRSKSMILFKFQSEFVLECIGRTISQGDPDFKKKYYHIYFRCINLKRSKQTLVQLCLELGVSIISVDFRRQPGRTPPII